MKKCILLSLAFLSLFFVACEDDEKRARIEVWLTDAPGDYQEVNVDIQGVEVHSNETDNEQGWQALQVTPEVYNLLELTNGEETKLGGLELPGGKISQIRLKLGEENTIKVKDVVYPLSTPSAQQSGLKLQINQALTAGITYKIVLDFDAAKSVVETGAGEYSLKPVIRAVAQAEDGAIEGKVEPAAKVAISVKSGEEVVTTTYSNENGEFLIRGLQPGTYVLEFDGEGDAPVVQKAAVEVQLGVVTDVGVVAVPVE